MLSGFARFVLNSAPVQWALAAMAIAVAWAGLLWRIRQETRRDVAVERLESTNERMEAGRDALRIGRDRGDPDERLRHNDKHW